MKTFKPMSKTEKIVYLTVSISSILFLTNKILDKPEKRAFDDIVNRYGVITTDKYPKTEHQLPGYGAEGSASAQDPRSIASQRFVAWRDSCLKQTLSLRNRLEDLSKLYTNFKGISNSWAPGKTGPKSDSLRKLMGNVQNEILARQQQLSRDISENLKPDDALLKDLSDLEVLVKNPYKQPFFVLTQKADDIRTKLYGLELPIGE